MADKFTITIAIPFTKIDNHFWLAVDSCLKQTLKADIFELICDAKLIDSQLNLIREYCLENGIHLFYDGENKGLAKRLNESIKRCSTDLYFRMDADDICDLTRLAVQTNYMENGCFDMCCAGAEFINCDGEVIGETRHCFGIMQQNNWSPYKELIVHPSVVFRTKWIKRYLYDEGMRRSQDKELWLRCYNFSSFFLAPERLIKYRRNDGSDKKRKRDNYKWSLVSSSKHWQMYKFQGFYRLVRGWFLFQIYRFICAVSNR